MFPVVTIVVEDYYIICRPALLPVFTSIILPSYVGKQKISFYTRTKKSISTHLHK